MQKPPMHNLKAQTTELFKGQSPFLSPQSLEPYKHQKPQSKPCFVGQRAEDRHPNASAIRLKLLGSGGQVISQSYTHLCGHL